MTDKRLRDALRVATDALLAERTPAGHWVGQLSSSALSTATAVVALAQMGCEADVALIRNGLRWLAQHANADGGWGDTVKSKSNISTTALGWAAFGAARADEEYRETAKRAEEWLTRARGPQTLSSAIAERYGKDRTFSVPILMMLALSGRIGWEMVTVLPFELAALPHQVFGALRLPVVSYALPALIAIGQTVHFHRPSRNPLARCIRELAKARTLSVLEAIQPANGSFLEATPLTSFVTMSLASMGLADHAVAQKGAAFLRASVQVDGSWQIDTNLATWLTTLAIKALAHQPGRLSGEGTEKLRDWLCMQQYREEHPFTHAAPYGWAWTDLPGGVPDADDTAGALLALFRLGPGEPRSVLAGNRGVNWLLNLQNRDGGIPTFCRGWGALPFDRSGPDLTAHALSAWHAWLPWLSNAGLKNRTKRAIARASTYLASAQRSDGSWLPLWFGNEHAPDDTNPLYGTAQVVLALAGIQSADTVSVRRGVAWIAAAQNEDGGWGGVKGAPSSVEETALAVEALAGADEPVPLQRGVEWLVERVESGAWRDPSPIGFYFAKLWYYERLYPLIFTVAALGKVAAR